MGKKGKCTMNKVIALLLVLLMTAAISIGATMAYNTEGDNDLNMMALGKVNIDQLEYERIDSETADENATVQEFQDNKPLVPGVYGEKFDFSAKENYVNWEQIGKEGYISGIWDPAAITNEVDKMVFVKNKGGHDIYVRSVFAFEAGNYTTLTQFRSMIHLNLNRTDYTWEWLEAPVAIGRSTYFVAIATYNNLLPMGTSTEISLSQIVLDRGATNEDVDAFGATYQILVQSQAIQSEGFDSPDVALNEGFGEIADTNIPWEDDAPIGGTDVYTALHYLDGGSEQITQNVRSITFGLSGDYTDITLQNKGTLVDVDQEVPAHAYYVSSGDSYDVYVLSSDTIYAPTDCSNLCNGMSNLVSFDSSNLDISRTTSMYRMFRDCGKLAEIDVSDWDTSNVTNMRDLFRGCKSLTGLDVSNWETGKVETLVATFQECVMITELDLNNWDVSNVKEAIQIFNKCNNLETLKISSWNPVSLADGTTMFQSCTSLKELDLSGWNTASLSKTAGMFNHCESLTKLDVSTWNMSKVADASLMFQSCHQLTELDLSKWNTPMFTNINSMFFECRKLTALDVGSWNVSNVTNFNQLFVRCAALESIDGLGNWETGKGTIFGNLFNGCTSLKELDLSNFDTANAGDLDGFFTNLQSLQKLTLGANFSCNANGKLGTGTVAVIPRPAAVEGGDGKWYNVETGVGYLPSEVPQMTAATYVAVNPANT